MILNFFDRGNCNNGLIISECEREEDRLGKSQRRESNLLKLRKEPTPELYWVYFSSRKKNNTHPSAEAVYSLDVATLITNKLGPKQSPKLNKKSLNKEIHYREKRGEAGPYESIGAPKHNKRI